MVRATATSITRLVMKFTPRMAWSFMPINGMPLTVSMSRRPRLTSYRSGTSRN